MPDYSHLIDIIRQPDELVLPGEQRLKLKKGGRAWRKRERQKKAKVDKIIERSHKRALTQKRYYEKNKEKLNRERALRNSQPEYVYYKAKDRAERYGIEWKFTLESWADLWSSAPKVYNEASGYHVPAWGMKGSDPSRCSQMIRIDSSGPWSPENCAIAYKGEVISNVKED